MARDESRTWLGRLAGETTLARFGTVLIAGGLGALVYAGAWELGLAPGSRIEVPPPVALQRAAERPESVSAGVVPDTAIPAADPVVVQPTMEPAIARAASGPLEPADAADRREAALKPFAGPAVRLAIPSIELETEVVQAGFVPGANGDLEWETVPFVAAHYGDLTALVGAPGNAVVSGHVVTLNEGNVFRDLYRIELGDRVEVFTPTARFLYEVDDVQLVTPSAVDVLAPSQEPRLTLITCGGTFDPRTRQFSDRLIVAGHLVAGERTG